MLVEQRVHPESLPRSLRLRPLGARLPGIREITIYPEGRAIDSSVYLRKKAASPTF